MTDADDADQAAEEKHEEEARNPGAPIFEEATATPSDEQKRNSGTTPEQAAIDDATQCVKCDADLRPWERAAHRCKPEDLRRHEIQNYGMHTERTSLAAVLLVRMGILSPEEADARDAAERTGHGRVRGLRTTKQVVAEIAKTVRDLASGKLEPQAARAILYGLQTLLVAMRMQQGAEAANRHTPKLTAGNEGADDEDATININASADPRYNFDDVLTLSTLTDLQELMHLTHTDAGHDPAKAAASATPERTPEQRSRDLQEIDRYRRGE